MVTLLGEEEKTKKMKGKKPKENTKKGNKRNERGKNQKREDGKESRCDFNVRKRKEREERNEW